MSVPQSVEDTVVRCAKAADGAKKCKKGWANKMEKGDCGEKEASALPCGSIKNEKTAKVPPTALGSQNAGASPSWGLGRSLLGTQPQSILTISTGHFSC